LMVTTNTNKKICSFNLLEGGYMQIHMQRIFLEYLDLKNQIL
jgi:hypothetical protein